MSFQQPLAVTILMGAALLGGVGEPKDAPRPAAVASFVLEPGEHKPGDVLRRAAEFLRRNIIWDEREIASAEMQPFTIQQRMELDARGCEAVVSQLFYTRHFAMVPLDLSRDVWQLINMNGPDRGEIMLRGIDMKSDEVLERRDLYYPVTCAVQLEHVRATVAVNSLRPFFMSTGQRSSLSIGSVGSDSALVLSGFAAQVAKAIQILETVDRATGEAERRDPTAIEELRARVEAIEKGLGIMPRPTRAGM